MAVKKTIIIDADTQKAVKGIDEVNESLDDTTQEQSKVGMGFSQMKGAADKFTGGAISGITNVIKGLRGAVAGMNLLKVAIAGTGIGALLIAFGSLVAFFTKTQRGADKINQVFKGVGATIDVLIDRLSSFGEGLFQILSGNFEEGWKTLKDSISGVGEEIVNESKAAFQLEKDLQNLQDREIAFIKVQAEKRRAIEAARLAAEDESLSDEERAKALREAIRVQNELTEEEISIAKERARIIKERVALGESTREDLEEQARAEARVIELETERDRRLRSVQTRLNAFTKGVKDNTKAEEANAKAKEKEEAARQKAIEAKEKEAEAQRKLNEQIQKELDALVAKSKQNEVKAIEDALMMADKIEEDYLNRSLSRQVKEENAVRDKYFALIEAAKQAGRDTITLEQAQAQELAEIKDKYALQDEQREIAIQRTKQQLASMALSALVGTLEQGSAAQKAVAVAQATFDTYKAIQSTFASAAANPSSILFPAQPYIQAGLAAAFGFANVKRILSAKPASAGGGGGGGGGSMPSPAVPSTPNVGFNVLQGVGNQITDAIGGANRTPVQAYVTTQSINNANQLDRKITSQASFG